MDGVSHPEEVLFETRHHATDSFSSSSDLTLHLQHQQQQQGVRGRLFSLLSSRGINQLKEKWSGNKRPRSLKKWASLFISPRGEYVAVAAGNRITILHKDDNYMAPRGVFIGNDRLTIFMHGAWSDSHAVLGVIDDMNTLYFIKANGEEITRMMNRQLKMSASIIGIIVQEDPDAENSCLCTFNLLMSDGLLHHIEVSQDPTASISYMPTSNNRLALLKQFPQNVACLDFQPKSSLLILVVGAGSASTNSKDSSGLYCLSLWRITRNSDIEFLFCSTHSEGLFSIPEGNVGPFTTPKVAISPRAKYAAALDLTGSLDIFNVDVELCSFSVISFDEKCHSQKSLSSRRKCLNDIVDFSWWSDHIVVLAKRTGVVTMVDICSGTKLVENDPLLSMPVLERVQECQGCVFLLESTSEDRHSLVSSDHRETADFMDIVQATNDQYNQLDTGRMRWRLMSFSEKSVSEMYGVLISSQQYQTALNFANTYGLDRDEVFKSQWLHSDQGTNEIIMFLANIKDQNFVLSECVDKVGSTEDAAKALLLHGLHITDQYRFSESEDGQCNLVWHFCTVRLQLLQYRDRLETFVGINMGRFSAPKYRKFRVVPLNEAAVTLAESGKIGALNLLFKRHPFSLAPFILDILAAIPETIPVQTYSQLLPGRSPPNTVSLRDRDWVECDTMIDFIDKASKDNESSIQVRTELIVKQQTGFVWPSDFELSLWYKNRARDIDSLSGQLENCISMVEVACQKGIMELRLFHEDILYLSHLIYSDVCDEEINFTMSVVAWEQLADYEKFKMMLKGVKEETVVGRLREKAIPFMQNRCYTMASASEDQRFEGHKQTDSFLVRWLKEIAAANELDICLLVIEEGCRDFQTEWVFEDEVEAVETTLQCIYLCTLTDRWNSMASILSKLPQITLQGNTGGYLEPKNIDKSVESIEKRVKLAEGHVEAGRLLAYYQVPKPMSYFLGAHSDEKSVKQLLRLILSKFGRRQPGRSDNDWANMWRDMQCFQEKAFPFLDTEYMLMEFCRGLLKAGKFSLARNYLKGTGSIALATEKAEHLVIQAAREYLFSASSLACTEIWRAKECLNLFPNSKYVKAEADVIDVLTVKLPNLGVTLLPMQFRQIRNPMEIINMVITSQSRAYLDIDELIEIAKLLGLSSQDDIAAVQEAVAREAAVTGDLQQAFDLCLLLAKKDHGSIWDLCAAIARGPVLENMDTSSRKLLLGFALSHCDEESVGELLHAWKDLDMQMQCEKLMTLTGTEPPNFSVQGSSIISQPAHDIQDIVGLSNFSETVEGSSGQEGNDDQEIHFENIKKVLSTVGKDLPMEDGASWDTLLRENGKVLSFAALQLPWLLELSRKEEYGKKMTLDKQIPGKQLMSIRTQAVVSILSWLAQTDIAPSDDLIASLAKSIMEPPVTEEEDILGCSFLLNLVDAFHGVEIIEEQLRTRERYQEICSIMSVGMIYSSLNNYNVECSSPAQRRKLLLHKFQEKHASLSSDAMDKIDKAQPTFWREWKTKLEEQKRLADQARIVEQIMPGVETARFLSGDLNYIRTAIFSFVDSAKLEKKPILKEALKLADTYGLNRTEVLLRYLASALVSELWANDDIQAEISDYKEEMVTCAAEVINTIATTVYPAIDGRNKQRLAYLYGMLSGCYSELKGTEELVLELHHTPGQTHTSELSQFYKFLKQECRRISFIKTFNFKNIAGLGNLNFEHFNEEVYAHVHESSVEALAKMVESLTGIYKDSVAKGLISWQDVYKHHILSLLTVSETDISKLHPLKPDDLRSFISELEQNYDCCGIYIRSLSEGYILDIMGRYYTSSLPHNCSESVSNESEWLDCLILLLNFWIRLVDDIQQIIFHENSKEKQSKFDPAGLLASLKVLKKLIMEDEISANQGWATVSALAERGLMATDTSNLCRAMVFSGCGFNAVAEVFSEAIAASSTYLSSVTDNTVNLDATYNLAHIYVNMTDLALLDLGSSDSGDTRNLHHLLLSLSKMEGNLADLKRVRYAVWERLSAFSHNMQLQSQIRVHALELMQSITGRGLRGLPYELVSDVQPWEGWDESDCAESREAADQGGPQQLDVPGRFTNTLVALKSTQLVGAISNNIEITPDDLMTLDSAVACFLRLSAAASSERHFEVLQAILEEWEGLFSTSSKDEEESGEVAKPSNDWSGDEWDEGWESFPEEPVDKEGKKGRSVSVHPLHICWMDVGKKLVGRSQLADVMKLIDRSLSKSKGILLTEDEAQSLSQLVLGIDCFMALKIVLLLPYEAIWLQCLSTVEAKLKDGGILDLIHGDCELLTLILASGALSTIATDSSYSAIFSYLCQSVGHLSRLCQEAQLSLLKHRGMGRNRTDTNGFSLFSRILFPCFVSELVKARHCLLAGFLVSLFMHTHASLNLINVAEASLRRYLEGQAQAQESCGPILDEINGCRSLVNSVSNLKGKLGTLLQAAMLVLSTNVK
ncbi:MAG2-interacting protein 2 isoform X2 [Magnolia sinica]|uniref:MAG2-interacting protein 2 isoform X2 n=1 Tax=Magnolia sinica TaxID=86752 RepID=UPI00265A0492|nr:MAG2-interacting protein 2 isoform X2 [Magnolia sinica]